MTTKEQIEALEKRIIELEKRPNVQYIPFYQYIPQPVYYPVYQPYYLQQPTYYGGLIDNVIGGSNMVQGNIC